MQCATPGGRVSQKVLSENICVLSLVTQAQWWREGQHAISFQSKAPFELLLWPVLPATCVNLSWSQSCFTGKVWEMSWQLPQLNYVTLVVLLPHPRTPSLVNSKMISPESCFAGCHRPCTLPMGCCPGDSANAKAFVCLDLKPLSREKNKETWSNQAPRKEHLSHSDYRYLPGTQEALSEWASTEKLIKINGSKKRFLERPLRNSNGIKTGKQGRALQRSLILAGFSIALCDDES